jgi:hypothetical protein
MIGSLGLRLALGDVEARAADVRASFSAKRVRALEAALHRAVYILNGQADHLDKASKRQAQQICAESAVFLTEVQEALRNQTPQNVAGVAHRAAVWLELLRTTSDLGAAPTRP